MTKGTVMRKTAIAFVWIAFVALVVGMIGIATAPTVSMAGSTVKLLDETGHGSGVYIGHGKVLTAAHVVKGRSQIGILTDDGRTGQGSFLWANTDYDLALVQIDVGNITSASLSCRVAAMGENVSATGSPGPMNFLTSWGRIGSSSVSLLGPWKEVIETGALIGPGMSGGGLWDADGRLIGINVGVLAFSATDKNDQPIAVTGSAFGLAVPGSTVCRLMGSV